MSATDQALHRPKHPSTTRLGATSVEVALLSLVFFTLVFGIIEISRLLYVFNTIQEVTRRAAAAAVNVFPTDTAKIDKLKQHAVFRSSPGALVLAPPITDAHVRLEYLKYDLSVIPQGSWPSDAASNKQICDSNPHASSCIRFVQAELCDPGDTSTCKAVLSQMMVPLFDLQVQLDKATTIAAVETLGYVLGTPPTAPPCPCP